MEYKVWLEAKTEMTKLLPPRKSNKKPIKGKAEMILVWCPVCGKHFFDVWRDFWKNRDYAYFLVCPFCASYLKIKDSWANVR